ncbi:MAG: PaaI family thioesterase [Ferrovibrio sp.]|uniref:PaaI family thioesterase n=1 Tax=Ferrovibrio sp. TaxID=1917215 RepID=UPI002615E00E|nr:PaaI family thioesterase [Ferrovibrio sp.]MCW0234287.1 PaaI family thioesterase [Ferrovibrio sp.]
MQMIPIDQGLAQVLGGPIAHDDEIGVRYRRSADQRVVLELPYAPFLAEAGEAWIGVGPLATVLDSVCGIGAMAAMGYRESTATVDLRIDYLRDPAPETGCYVAAQAVHVGGEPEAGMVMMRAEARETGSETLLACATGEFIRRRLPKLEPRRGHGAVAAMSTAPNYRGLMEFVSQPDGLRMPFRPGLVGNGSLPSLHGGAVAAHLQRAAGEAVAKERSGRPARLTTAHFSFLRFAGTADTLAQAEIDHLGASVASVRVTSTQEVGRVIARAACTFLCL